MFFKNKGSVLMIISLILICIFQSFNTPIMAVIISDYGIPETQIGFIFAIPCFTYFITTLVISFVIHKIPRRLLFFGSFIFITFGLLLMGPSALFGLPNNDFSIIMVGWSLIGIAEACLYIPIMPEIIESIQVEHGIVIGKNEEVDHQLNDKTAGIYATFYSLGAIMSPNVGSILYMSVGYRATCDILAMVALAYALCYFCVNVGFNVFEKERKHKE